MNGWHRIIAAATVAAAAVGCARRPDSPSPAVTGSLPRATATQSTAASAAAPTQTASAAKAASTDVAAIPGTPGNMPTVATSEAASTAASAAPTTTKGAAAAPASVGTAASSQSTGPVSSAPAAPAATAASAATVPPTQTPATVVKPAPKPSVPLTLSITDPASDTVELPAGTTQASISGRTAPDAVVTVGTDLIDVSSSGSFQTTVLLDGSINVVDIVASDTSGAQVAAQRVFVVG